MNFCFEFLFELLIIWEAITNTQKRVSSDIQTFWSWLKTRQLHLIFSILIIWEIWWNTLPCVWYIITWNKIQLDLKWSFVFVFLFKATYNNICTYIYIYIYIYITQSWFLQLFRPCSDKIQGLFKDKGSFQGGSFKKSDTLCPLFDRLSFEVIYEMFHNIILNCRFEIK